MCGYVKDAKNTPHTTCTHKQVAHPGILMTISMVGNRHTSVGITRNLELGLNRFFSKHLSIHSSRFYSNLKLTPQCNQVFLKTR